MTLVKFKRDFFDRDGKYYERGTREYNGPLKDEHGRPLLPGDAVVVEGAKLPFQPDSPVPKPGFGAQPLEQQVQAMVPGAADDGQIHSPDAGSKPVELTEEERKAKEADAAKALEAEKAKTAEDDKQVAADIAEGAKNAEKAAEVVKEVIDPTSVLNLGKTDKKK